MKVTIEGMGCAHCVTAVREALEALPGVQVEEVEIGSATVRLAETGGPGRSQVLEAIRGAGYRPRE